MKKLRRVEFRRVEHNGRGYFSARGRKLAELLEDMGVPHELSQRHAHEVLVPLEMGAVLRYHGAGLPPMRDAPAAALHLQEEPLHRPEWLTRCLRRDPSHRRNSTADRERGWSLDDL